MFQPFPFLSCAHVKRQALELSSVETLIVYEDLDVQRYEIKNLTTGGASDSLLQCDCNAGFMRSGFLFVEPFVVRTQW